MVDINEVFKHKNDKPTVIFDLKGPIPRISKIGTGKRNQIDVKKDQLIKIVHENSKIEDSDIIHVDKKIIQCIEVGDQILIDSSQCILKVISIQRYRKRNSLSKISGAKTFDKIMQNNLGDNNDIYDDFLEEDITKKFNFNNEILDVIVEKDEDEQFQHVDDVDFSVEDRLKQRENNMSLAYKNIVKKHLHYSEYNRINELERICLSASVSESCSSKNHFNEFSEKHRR
jgi:hypothetical protein